MRLLEFWYCRYTLSIAIAVLLVLLTIHKRNISHIAIILLLYVYYITEWTTEGCVAAEVNGDVVTCNCNHLTNFAILVNSSECTFIGHI